jgi:hypothetical protein
MKDIIKEDTYLRAKKRVAKIKGFYIHLAVYLIVNAIIITLNTIASGWNGFISSLLSISLFWGIGLVFHWYGIFGKNLFFSKEWEERKIQELMNKNKLF